MTNNQRHIQGLLPETQNQMQSQLELLKKLYKSNDDENKEKPKSQENTETCKKT